MNNKNNIENTNTPLGVRAIFLIGLMGTGKTFWANDIAPYFHLQQYDLDNIIELAEGKTISQIFEDYGEEYFRKKEAEHLRSFAHKKKFMLATGGGTPCFNDNMNWMNEHGITIWIDEEIDTLVQRLKKEKDHRPLIKNLNDAELKSFLSDKLEERKIFYAKAKHHLTKEEISRENFIKIIEQYV